MSAFLCELKIPLVVAGVIAMVLSLSRIRRGVDDPVYMAPADPKMYQRVTASRGTASENPAPAVAHLFYEPSDN